MLRVTVPRWERLWVGPGGGPWRRREHAGLGSVSVKGVFTSPGGSALRQGAPRSAQGSAAPLGQARPSRQGLLLPHPGTGSSEAPAPVGWPSRPWHAPGGRRHL